MSSPTRSGEPPALERKIGPLQATAINMTQMCGIGPFVTIPAMVATMGGPQAMFGWIIGAIVALADGLIWAELGAAMPGAGPHVGKRLAELRVPHQRGQVLEDDCDPHVVDRRVGEGPDHHVGR